MHGDPTVAAPRPGEIHVPWDLLPDDSPQWLTVTVDGRIGATAGGRRRGLGQRRRRGAGDAGGAHGRTRRRGRSGCARSTAPTRRTSAATWTRWASTPAPSSATASAERAWVELQLDVLTGAVVALLGIAVVIALVGIGNTLGLSVLERARENALLRALGLTRRQLRRMLAVEAVLLSVVATVLGTFIGAAFAWVAVEALVKAAVDEAPLVLPWGQLALVVLVAGAAGLLSCLLPAQAGRPGHAGRRAGARVSGVSR